MKNLGYLLITGGFLAASYVAVRDPETIPVGLFLATLAVGGLGVASVRFATHSAAHSEEKLTTNIETLGTRLGRIVENVERFEEEKASIDVYELRHHVEETFSEDLMAFVDARESMAHSYGLQAYAEVMSHFASGERHLNRVWSASTDGYVDEAHAYVTKAVEQFRDARQSFEKLSAAP